MNKSRTLQKAAFRIECLLADYTTGLPERYRRQLQQAHREVKQVRNRLQHEGLIERTEQ